MSSLLKAWFMSLETDLKWSNCGVLECSDPCLQWQSLGDRVEHLVLLLWDEGSCAAIPPEVLSPPRVGTQVADSALGWRPCGEAGKEIRRHWWAGQHVHLLYLRQRLPYRWAAHPLCHPCGRSLALHSGALARQRPPGWEGTSTSGRSRFSWSSVSDAEWAGLGQEQRMRLPCGDQPWESERLSSLGDKWNLGNVVS